MQPNSLRFTSARPLPPVRPTSPPNSNEKGHNNATVPAKRTVFGSDNKTITTNSSPGQASRAGKPLPRPPAKVSPDKDKSDYKTNVEQKINTRPTVDPRAQPVLSRSCGNIPFNTNGSSTPVVQNNPSTFHSHNTEDNTQKTGAHSAWLIATSSKNSEEPVISRLGNANPDSTQVSSGDAEIKQISSNRSTSRFVTKQSGGSLLSKSANSIPPTNLSNRVVSASPILQAESNQTSTPVEPGSRFVTKVPSNPTSSLTGLSFSGSRFVKRSPQPISNGIPIGMASSPSNILNSSQNTLPPSPSQIRTVASKPSKPYADSFEEENESASSLDSPSPTPLSPPSERRIQLNALRALSPPRNKDVSTLTRTKTEQPNNFANGDTSDSITIKSPPTSPSAARAAKRLWDAKLNTSSPSAVSKSFVPKINENVPLKKIQSSIVLNSSKEPDSESESNQKTNVLSPRIQSAEQTPRSPPLSPTTTPRQDPTSVDESTEQVQTIEALDVAPISNTAVKLASTVGLRKAGKTVWKARNKRPPQLNDGSVTNPTAVLPADMPALKHRRMLLIEILGTEEDYVSDLDVISEVFYNPLKELGVISPIQLDEIFCNFEMLANVNRQLLNDLKAKLRNHSTTEMASVGDLFSTAAEAFKVYKPYCNNQPISIQTFEMLNKKKPAFASFVKDAEQDPRCKGLTLFSFLIKPIQRLCKYPLFIHQLLKDTPQDSPDYEILEKALKRVEDLVEHINESKRKVEMQQQLLELQQSISALPETILSPSRRLIKQGPVVAKIKCGVAAYGSLLVAAQMHNNTPQQKSKFHHPKSIQNMSIKSKQSKHFEPRQAILFNDLILFVKRETNKSKSKPYKWKGQLPMNTIKTQLIAGDDFCQLFYGNPNNAEPDFIDCTFYCENDVQETRNWIKQLKSNLKEVQQEYALRVEASQQQQLRETNDKSEWRRSQSF